MPSWPPRRFRPARARTVKAHSLAEELALDGCSGLARSSAVKWPSLRGLIPFYRSCHDLLPVPLSSVEQHLSSVRRDAGDESSRAQRAALGDDDFAHWSAPAQARRLSTSRRAALALRPPERSGLHRNGPERLVEIVVAPSRIARARIPATGALIMMRRGAPPARAVSPQERQPSRPHAHVAEN